VSTPTPAERAEQVIAETLGPPKPDQGQSMRRRVAVMFAQAIREAEEAARQEERATCARIVRSGIHCGAPPESIAAMMNAGAELDPLGTLGSFEEPVRYLTDDRDRTPRYELMLMQGGDGDWYVSVLPEGYKIGPTVRLCTSGGAASAAPGLTEAISQAYRALARMRRTPDA
jgi:hypothetical protein